MYTTKNKPEKRCFHLKWMDEFPWLLYSKSKDSAFCCICTKFSTKYKNDQFVSSGFSNWKKEMNSDSGFKKHEKGNNHIEAAFKSSEHNRSIKDQRDIHTLLGPKILSDRRFYFSKIISTIRFIAKNGLPFRGDGYDDVLCMEKGLFTDLLKLIMAENETFKRCADQMPRNALYTSLEMQNEIIQAMANSLQKFIVNEMNHADYLTILVDGTKDKHGIEILSVAFRFVNKNDDVVERIIGFEKTDDQTAEGIFDRLKTLFDKCGIDNLKDRLICQCYDGASVNSGRLNGLKMKFERHFNKVIPYVHCFSHRLHLVVIEIVKNQRECIDFFLLVSNLHNFLKKVKVRKLYEGKSIPLLIDQRWSSHSRATSSIKKNYSNILKCLEIASDSVLVDGDDRLVAGGLYLKISQPAFRFLVNFLADLFEEIEPVNKMLQGRELSYSAAVPLIDGCIERLKGMRAEEEFFKYAEAAVNLCGDENEVETAAARRSNRQCSQNSRLSQSIVTSTIGQSRRHVNLKGIYFEILDWICAEFEKRFTENNEILIALHAANN